MTGGAHGALLVPHVSRHVRYTSPSITMTDLHRDRDGMFQTVNTITDLHRDRDGRDWQWDVQVTIRDLQVTRGPHI